LTAAPISPDGEMSDAGLPAVGALAPDFELLDQHGTHVRLSSFRGSRNVLLVFYPWSFSGVCTGELCVLRDDLASFQNDDSQLLAVSIDSKYVQRVFADREGLEFPVLADFWPHGEVARRYGVFDDVAGVALRGTFVIDREGIVRWSVLRGIPDARDPNEYRRVLSELR
jgi:mycoredoxin-dependent peroxiredoxin